MSKSSFIDHKNQEAFAYQLQYIIPNMRACFDIVWVGGNNSRIGLKLCKFPIIFYVLELQLPYLLQAEPHALILLFSYDDMQDFLVLLGGV